MKKKFLSILTVFVLTTMLYSPISAGGNIKLTRFRLGSLIADGYASGIGKTDVTMVLDASGIPIVTCTNQGGNQAPGQNPSRVSASGQEDLLGSDPLRKNGKAPFSVETEDPETLPGNLGGCPNAHWTANVVFILWTDATLSLYNTATNALIARQNYTCVTTQFPPTVECTLK